MENAFSSFTAAGSLFAAPGTNCSHGAPHYRPARSSRRPPRCRHSRPLLPSHRVAREGNEQCTTARMKDCPCSSDRKQGMDCPCRKKETVPRRTSIDLELCSYPGCGWETAASGLAGHRNGEAQRRGQPHEPARRWAPPRASAAWYAAETRQAGWWGAGGLADELWATGGGRQWLVRLRNG